MSAPELTPEEAAKVAEFEAAPTPPEVLREQVARELWAADAEVDVDQLSGETPQRLYRLADAALAVFRGQQDPERREVPEDVAVTLLRGLTWCAAQISDEDREEAWAWVETGRANVEEMGS